MHTLQFVPNPYIGIISEVDFRQNLCPVQILIENFHRLGVNTAVIPCLPYFLSPGMLLVTLNRFTGNWTANTHIIITETGDHDYASWYLELQRQSQVINVTSLSPSLIDAYKCVET